MTCYDQLTPDDIFTEHYLSFDQLTALVAPTPTAIKTVQLWLEYVTHPSWLSDTVGQSIRCAICPSAAESQP